MFESIKELANNIISLDENKMLFFIFEDENMQSQIIELNKKQLSEGKGADFNDLPRYEDDRYFKTIKSAKAYEAFKATISQNPSKPVGVMDFYIDGTFYSTIEFKNGSKGFYLVSNSDIAKDVQNKTDNKALGLSGETINLILPEVQAKLIEQIKGKIGI